MTLAFSEGEWSVITTAAASAGLTAAEYVRRWAVGGADLMADVGRLLTDVEATTCVEMTDGFQTVRGTLCRCVRRSLSRITGP